MIERDSLTPPTSTSSTDQLTGLDPTLAEAISPVRVEVLDDAETRLRNSTAEDGEQCPTIETLRRTIANAEERFSQERSLRQRLEERDQQLMELQQETEILRDELSRAHRQLAEIDNLCSQLQALLDRG